jgi:predicted NAD-dependent protein-ADP-ribosyltransferase YbiA (DUF1768 family)
METENEIYFYGLKDEFSYMSNFYKTKFIDEDGIEFRATRILNAYFISKKIRELPPYNL